MNRLDVSDEPVSGGVILVEPGDCECPELCNHDHDN
jgi:hypothetical protein